MKRRKGRRSVTQLPLQGEASGQHVALLSPLHYYMYLHYMYYADMASQMTAFHIRNVISNLSNINDKIYSDLAGKAVHAVGVSGLPVLTGRCGSLIFHVH